MPAFTGEELETWSGGRWEGSRRFEARGVSTDTRNLVPGSLYIAIRGKRFDGHAFVEQAFEKGAVAAMVSDSYQVPAVLARHGFLGVKETLAALQSLARGYRASLKIDIVGVTGSVGKSTVKEMTANVLGVAAPTARTRGNWNNEIGVPLSLLAMDRGTSVGVFEVGTSHPGELAPLCRMLSPSWGIVTNVGPVHMEFFASMDAIADEKGRLLESLSANGTSVLTKDDAFFNKLRSKAPARVITVSMKYDADYTTESISDNGQEAVVREKASGERFSFRLPVCGDHNVGNAMFAIAVARGRGMGWDDIRRGLEAYRPLPMRWAEEHVCGVTIINDAYNANPVSMRAAVDTFARMKTVGRKWLVMAGMLELGAGEREAHIDVGRHVGRMEWGGLVTVGERGTWIAAGAREAGLAESRIYTCGDCAEAAQVLFHGVSAGDAILLKGSRGTRLETVRDQYVLLSV